MACDWESGAFLKNIQKLQMINLTKTKQKPTS